MTRNGAWLSRENCFGESPKICSRVNGRLDVWLLWCLGAGGSRLRRGDGAAGENVKWWLVIALEKMVVRRCLKPVGGDEGVGRCCCA